LYPHIHDDEVNGNETVLSHQVVQREGINFLGYLVLPTERASTGGFRIRRQMATRTASHPHLFHFSLSFFRIIQVADLG